MTWFTVDVPDNAPSVAVGVVSSCTRTRSFEVKSSARVRLLCFTEQRLFLRDGAKDLTGRY
jgi:hypothetical protein